MLICLVAAGCGDSPRSISSPASPTPIALPVPAGGYTLTGTIRDPDGRPLPDITVVFKGSGEGQSVSDAAGRYSITNVSGSIDLRVSMHGYADWSAVRYVAANQVVDITLSPIVELVPGSTFHGTVNGSPCDPIAWDARAPCRQLFFTAPASGTLDLVLTWSGQSDLDMLAGGQYFTSITARQIHATVPVGAGVRTEIRINAYYRQEPFELRVGFQPEL
jgi:hypothetical protein